MALQLRAFAALPEIWLKFSVPTWQLTALPVTTHTHANKCNKITNRNDLIYLVSIYHVYIDEVLIHIYNVIYMSILLIPVHTCVNGVPVGSGHSRTSLS